MEVKKSTKYLMFDRSTFLTINNCSAVAIEGTAVNNCLHTLLILVDSREVDPIFDRIDILL